MWKCLDFRASRRLVAGVVVLIGLLAGCGSGTNVNQIWGKDDDAYDSLYLRARAAYDRGDFADAKSLAERARNINSRNEDVNILLGYIHLSLGGIDPFILARRLVENNSSTTAAALTQGGAAASGSSSSGVSGTLQSLGKIISLGSTDLDALSSLVETPADSIFATIPLRRPKIVNASLREAVPVLREMNNAIRYICGFVDPKVTEGSADPRDTAENCPQITGSREQTYKAHFLWAFAHLTEALVFQSVLLYSDGNQNNMPNIEQRSKAVSSGNFTTDASGGITKFVSTVDELQESVDAVFASEAGEAGAVTQLSATLNAMDSVTKAFSALPGIPDSLTSQITKSMDSLRTIGGETAGQTRALRAQMTEKLSQNVATKIDATVCAKFGGGNCANVPAEAKASAEVQELCSSYTTLANGLEASKKKPPQVCS